MEYYIDKEVILEAHKFLMINEENKGLVNEANLDYAVYEYQKPKYENIIVKSSALMFNIIRGHCFIDGNKRTALLSAATLLLFNGYELKELPEIYSEHLLKVAKEAPNLKDEEVKNYIIKISKDLEKHVRKMSKEEHDSMKDLMKVFGSIMDSFNK
jgi:death-on-curing protein